MPGVTITTAVRTGPTSDTVRDSSQAFFVGLAERGPVDEAILVGSLAEFAEVFGDYVTYAYLQPTVQTFFEEGGTQCYVVRVAGPDATTASLSLTDGDVDVLTLTANGPGDWAHNVSVSVTASGSNRNLKLYYNGVAVFATGLKGSNALIANAINNSPIANKYVSATVVDTGLVQAISDTSLAGGADDRADATITSTFTAYVDALALFLDAYGPGAVACAETHAINTDLIAHANAYNRVALLYIGEGSDSADAKAAALDLTGETGAEHAALYFPWVYIPTDVTGVNRLIPPVGLVAGARAKAHNTVGPQQPYAGLIASAKFVNGLELDLNKTSGDDLDENYVNALRMIANSVRVYGARSLSTDENNFRYITVQDTVNSIVHAANASVEDLIFSVIDGRGGLFSSIEGRLKSVCEAMRIIGALYPAYDANGKLIDNGYSVKCDASINTTAQLAEGKVKAQVGLRVSSIGDKIEVTIIKSNLTGTVTA